MVPLYDSAKADPAKPINAAASEMKFADYIDLIQKQPTDLRILNGQMRLWLTGGLNTQHLLPVILSDSEGSYSSYSVASVYT